MGMETTNKQLTNELKAARSRAVELGQKVMIPPPPCENVLHCAPLRHMDA
jgi:hypothetical protein